MLSQSRHILIVEDHDDTAEVLALMLRRLGHDVQIASTLEQAKCKILDRKYEVVLCDIELPDGDGTDIPMIARLGNPGVRLVATSGRGMPKEVSAILKSGFDVHLLKPYEMNALLAELS